MDLSIEERAVMQRFAQKTRMAGGPRVGYVLRRRAAAPSDEGGVDAEFDLDGALTGLVEKGLLAASEGGDFVFLTERGVESLSS